MKKSNLIGVALLAVSICTFAQEWSKQNGFENWSTVRNANFEIDKDSFVLKDIKKDVQIIIDPVSIDPSKCNVITYRYRAEEVKELGGEIFYARPNGRFNGREFWRLPKLIADGKWHTVKLTAKNLNNPSSYFNGGMITKLRFDITNGSGKKIEIAELKFSFEETAKPQAVKPQTPKAVATLIKDTEWSKKNSFAGWRAVNGNGEIKGDAFILSNMKPDPQILIAPVAIDSKKFNTIKYSYRATGKNFRKGQLYFAAENQRFSPKQCLVLPGPIGDGKIHTVTMVLPESWRNCGEIKSLRFDPTDSAAEKIEILELGFFLTKI